MARPAILLSDDQVREVETLAALLSQQQIADYFGISRRSFQNILDRDEAVLARYKRGRAKAIAHVANGLLQKARSGCTTSSIFYLKTQAGWREKSEVEHSGSVAGSRAGVELRMLLAEKAARLQGLGLPKPDDGLHPAISAREPDNAG